jgi:hypothetical protein
MATPLLLAAGFQMGVSNCDEFVYITFNQGDKITALTDM